MFCYGWWYPTTLTAGRALWSQGASLTNFAKIDTTTTQLRLVEDHTTDGEWTTTDAGLVVNKWSFIAFLWTPLNAGGSWRVWAGAVDAAPTELTVSVAVAAIGNLAGGGANLAVGNATGNIPIQGDIAEFGYLIADVNTSHPPLFLAAAGSITDAEADFAYRRFVLPAWLGQWAVPQARGAGAGANPNRIEVGRLVLNKLPVIQVAQSGDLTTLPGIAPTITGATLSGNGHPLPPHSSQLFARSSRR